MVVKKRVGEEVDCQVAIGEKEEDRQTDSSKSECWTEE